MPDNDKIQLPKGFKLEEPTPGVKLPSGFTLDTEVVKKKVGGEDFSLTKLPSLSPDFEKGKAFAEKGFLMQAEGTKAPKQKKISMEPSLSGILGAPPKVSVVEEGEQSPLADFSSAIIKGQLQGKVANILSAGRKPTPEELGEIAQLQSDIQLFPQSRAEKVYQEKGLKGIFKDNPTLGVEFVAETMANSLSSLVEASRRTVPAATLAGAAAGAPFAGIGALPGAAVGLVAGQSAAGYNLSTSQDILSSLSDNGVDITNKDSLIKAFSDENKMAKIRKTAAQYGIPILIFDAATAGLAGKLAAGAMGKSLAKKLLAGVGETGLQMIGGGGGELAGQLASGKKVNWDEIAMEALAEVPGGATEVAGGVIRERAKTASSNKIIATQIATQGIEDGAKDALVNLNRDLANKVISPEQHQEGVSFIEIATEVADKVPENVIGENRIKSIQLLAERNEMKSANQELLAQKQNTDEAYHAGIDAEIKANEERIKKIDTEVYDISKAPQKEKERDITQFHYTLRKKEISPIEVKEEVKPAEVKELSKKSVEELGIINKPEKPLKAKPELTEKQLYNKEMSRIDDIVDRVEAGDIKGSNISVSDKDLTEHLIDKGLDGRESYVVKDMLERLIKPLKNITDKIDPTEVKFFTENVEDMNSVIEGLEDARTGMFLRNKDVVNRVNQEAQRLLDYYSDKNNLSKETLDTEKTFEAKVDLLNKFLNGEVNYLDLSKFGIEKKLKDYAIQKPSASRVLQPTQEGIGETRSERERVEPSIQGEEIAKESKQPKVYEEEKGLSLKGLKAAETRKINEAATKVIPETAREMANAWLSNKDNEVSWDAIRQVAGTVKKAELNLGKSVKSEEIATRDYAAKAEGQGLGIDGIIHSIWDNLSEKQQSKISESDIREAVMESIRDVKSRKDATKSLVKTIEKTEEQLHWERIEEENKEALEKELADIEVWMIEEGEREYAPEFTEEHINNIIEQYEAESKEEAKRVAERVEREGAEEAGTRAGREKAKKPESKIETEYKDAISTSGKKAKENAKKAFVDRNFDSIVQKLKIQTKCPT